MTVPDPSGEFGTGAERIAAERQRQVEAEGWTPEHDGQWSRGELVQAARAYAAAYDLPFMAADHVGWPWHEDWWKPSEDPVRNLEKAGALIAAEIDRLQQASVTGRSHDDDRCPHGFPSGGWDCCRHDPSLDDHMEDT